MSSMLKPKISISEGLLSTSACEKPLPDNNPNNSFHSPYEIFRNNTTAVEVIVKEIRNKGKRRIITNVDKKDKTESATIKKLDGDIKKLRNELQNVNLNLEEAQKSFKVILSEMKKQLEVADLRELQIQTKCLALQMEKEKLKTLLDSKTNLVAILKKEFTAMRRMLKIVIKSIRSTSPCPEIVHHSDVEYKEFEKDLRNSALVAVAGNSLDDESGLESIIASK